jgi:hypothetical protein
MMAQFPGSFTRTIIILTICTFPNMGRTLEHHKTARCCTRHAWISKHGGIMLMGAGLYVGCQQIKSAQTIRETNEKPIDIVGHTGVSNICS